MNLDYLKTYNIKFLDNKICLRDLITQTNNKKFSQNIIEFAKGKTYDNNGHIYIGSKTAIKILNQFKTKHSENILEELKKQNNLETLSLTSDDECDSNSGALIIAPKNQIIVKKNIGNEFVFWGHTFTYLAMEEKDDEGYSQPMVYFCGMEIAEFLEYVKTEKAISDHVDIEYKKTLKEILDSPNFRPLNFKGLNFRPPNLGGLTYNDKKKIYISKYGLFQLVIKSKKAEAKKFQRYLVEKVIPSLLEKGYYATNENLMINFDTSCIISILDTENLDKYNGYNVVYMIVITNIFLLYLLYHKNIINFLYKITYTILYKEI
jgi:prophage antirepressor-like protein